MKNKKNDINQDLIDNVYDLIDKGITPQGIKVVISKKTGFKKTKCNDIYNEIIKNKDFQEDIFDFDLEIEDKQDEPYFNPETKKYVVYLKCLGRNIVVSESKHKKILEMYSDWDSEAKTINEICRAISWPREVLTEYLKKHGIDHSSLPITNEDLEQHSDEELVGRLQELRKFSLYQKFEKEGWDSVRADAQKWRAFKFKQLDPFIDFVKDWTPPKYDKLLKQKEVDNNTTLLIVLSDLHFGNKTNEDLTFRNGDNNSNWIKYRVDYFRNLVEQDAIKQKASKIKVMFLGDILNSAGTNGLTNKGTVVDNDLKGGAVFKLALDTLARFLNGMLETGLEVSCVGCSGNHDAALGLGLLYALKSYYRNEIPNFEISHKFIDKTIINQSLVIYSHGAHGDIKAKIPPANRVHGYAQSLFLEAQKDFPNPSSRYIFQGDLHHSRTQEFNDCEYILVPSLVGTTNYSDALNLNSRVRQQTFLFDDAGIKTVNNYYLD